MASELGIVRCGKCERRYVGPECPFCRYVADPVASADLSPVDVAIHPDTCSVCGEREPQAGRRVCSGCRKAAQRAKS
jgi:hypothetical protein